MPLDYEPMSRRAILAISAAGALFYGGVAWLAFDVGRDLARQGRQHCRRGRSRGPQGREADATRRSRAKDGPAKPHSASDFHLAPIEAVKLFVDLKSRKRSVLIE